MAAETTPAGGREVSFIQDTYWMVLGRAATPSELADEQQGHLNKDQLTLLRGIMASPEFSRLRRAWRDGRETHARRSLRVVQGKSRGRIRGRDACRRRSVRRRSVLRQRDRNQNQSDRRN